MTRVRVGFTTIKQNLPITCQTIEHQHTSLIGIHYVERGVSEFIVSAWAVSWAMARLFIFSSKHQRHQNMLSLRQFQSTFLARRTANVKELQHRRCMYDTRKNEAQRVHTRRLPTKDITSRRDSRPYTPSSNEYPPRQNIKSNLQDHSVGSAINDHRHRRRQQLSKHQEASNTIASEAHRPGHQPRLLCAVYSVAITHHTCPCDKHDKTPHVHSIIVNQARDQSRQQLV